MTDEAIIDAYWRYHRLSTGDRTQRLASEEWFWAWQHVDELVDEALEGDEVIGFLVALAEAASDEGELGFLGAGPVEDLIRRHGHRYVDRLEQAARRCPAFRTALRRAWYDEDLAPEVVARLRLLGRPL